MKRVLIRPSFQDWCENRLFFAGTSFEGVYQGAFAQWRQVAERQAIQIDTWDCAPLEAADVLWFLDLPPTRQEFESIQAKLKQGTKMVLQILESPALTWNAFLLENIKEFDAVVTYEHPDSRSARKKCFYYHLPNTLRLPVANPPFCKRKGILVLNSNRVEGWWAVRQFGVPGLPMVGKLLAGWKCGLRNLQEHARGELYSARRALLREAEQTAAAFVDLYGRGWNGEQVSWCPLYQNRPYLCWRGKASGSKAELSAQYRFVLAFENYRGNLGYISEKIFDVLFAGSVPVYLGEERVTEFVPQDCFVDACKFNNHRDLLMYLRHCPKREWQAMREAGQAFIKSDAILPFTDEAFVERMMGVLENVLR
jgi:hypothetical protein